MKKTTLFLMFMYCHYLAYPQESITIHANQPLDSNIQFMQGFLHGNPRNLDSVLTAKLQPAFWRIGAYALAGSGYEDAIRFNPKITININDYYMIVNNITSQSASKPWLDNWVKWDEIVTVLATNSVNFNAPVTYWDAWGEPDNFWTGTYGQWIEMYRRTDSILNAIIPNARLIGPEFGFGACNFAVAPIMQFMDSVYQAGGSIAGISWHEFCAPEQVPGHVSEVREALAQRPWLGNPEILIPEYAGPANSTIPGWNVGWLFAFETAKVDWVSHACWNESDGNQSWSNCEHGLNGLFMPDNTTPQANYWVHRAYAELNPQRLETSGTHPRTVALASKNDAKQEMKMLIGRYDHPNLGAHNAPAQVSVVIQDYPYCTDCTVPMVIQRIPSNHVPYTIPLYAPQTTSTLSLEVVGHTAQIEIPEFVDGDAYIVYVQPDSGSVLTAEGPVPLPRFPWTISPNPVCDLLHIRFEENQSTPMHIFNAMGQIVRTFSAGPITDIPIGDLPAGIYFIRANTGAGHAQKFIKCAE